MTPERNKALTLDEVTPEHEQETSDGKGEDDE